MEAKEILDAALKVISECKAIDIKTIDIRGISSFADYFICCEGTNSRQIQAIADRVDDKLSTLGVNPVYVEGYNNANWILMDYSDVIIHIFDNESRKYYDLERIWADGTITEYE